MDQTRNRLWEGYYEESLRVLVCPSAKSLPSLGDPFSSLGDPFFPFYSPLKKLGRREKTANSARACNN